MAKIIVMACDMMSTSRLDQVRRVRGGAMRGPMSEAVLLRQKQEMMWDMV